jgi:L-ascorbate metabolism protein UlaG (beta-lactamase superfamily)
MQMIKFTHACVRLNDGDRAVLLDPGIWTEAAAWEGVTDVLVTHEHADHVDVGRLVEHHGSAPDLRVYAPDPIASQLAERIGAAVTVVLPGQALSVGGLTVEVVGGRHAVTWNGYPNCANVGYVVGDGNQTVYHPGDSLFVPSAKVDVLLTPVSGPWFKLGEGIDFIRAVAPQRAFPIHDRMLSADIGMSNVDGWLEEEGQTDYTRAALGEPVQL